MPPPKLVYRARLEEWGVLGWTKDGGFGFYGVVALPIEPGNVSTLILDDPLVRSALPSPIRTLTGPLVVGFQLTNECNLQCRYCFAEPPLSGQALVSNPRASDIASRICALKPLVVWLSGGEPTLVPELPDVIRLFESFGIPTTLDTNATLLSDELLAVLGSARQCQVRVSLDSHEVSVHNRLRGMGAVTIKALSRMVDVNLDVAVHTVVTRENAPDLILMRSMLIDLGVKKWILFDLVAAGWATQVHSDLAPSNYENEIEALLAVSRDSPLSVAHVMGNRPRCMVLVDSLGGLYTAAGPERLRGGSVLDLDPGEAWRRLPLDYTAHVEKYVNRRVS